MTDNHDIRALDDIGVVVIGRNEGNRLQRCLESVNPAGANVVYVDSGSTDQSAELAHAMGVEVVELDMNAPFTAARARNTGFQRLHELAPNMAYVQFVDGDCEIVDNWIAHAAAFLDSHKDVAAVCGRLRERHPERSIYNMLCDIEWDTPPGNVKACGGNAMMRVDAYKKAGGFLPDLIAGEEPELCLRMRAAGWRIWRLDAEMALHDAAMYRFRQWWKRTLRTGYTYAQGAHMHGSSPERYRVRESHSAQFWGLGLPLMTVICTLSFGAIGLVILTAYPLQVIRLALRGNRSSRENGWRAFFLVIGKFPEMLGQIKFLYSCCSGRRQRLIEYK